MTKPSPDRNLGPTLGSTFELDRQSDKRGDAAYLAGLLEDSATRFLILSDGRPIVRPCEDGSSVAIAWFTPASLVAAGFNLSPALFLGSEMRKGTALFALPLASAQIRSLHTSQPALSADTDLRALATQGALPESELALIGLAKALNHWHENMRCCGRCGGMTSVKEGGWKRRCRSCGREHFPRLDPVVIMLTVHPAGDRCLLAHEGRFRENMFSALAGYIEPGEDVAHAVRREVFEETQVRVGDVHFHASQSWPFPHTLMLGCIAAALTEEICPDATEIEEARWFTRADARGMLKGNHPQGLFVPGPQAIAHTLIKSFADGEQE